MHITYMQRRSATQHLMKLTSPSDSAPIPLNAHSLDHKDTPLPRVLYLGQMLVEIPNEN